MKYTGIADVSNALAERLREYMVPELVKSPYLIGLCSPGDKGDFMVGIYLYDIRECEELRNHDMVTIDSSRQKYPSSFVTLFYMITAYSNGDIRYRAEEELRILGKVIQILKDYAVLDGSTFEGDGNGQRCSIEMQNLSMEEKIHLFNVPGMGYKTSLFYEIGPVEIESVRTKHVKRVVDITFGVEEMKKERPL